MAIDDLEASYSLIESGLGCLSGPKTSNLTGDPNLGPLQDNGGPTLTHALLEGSPAIDAGDSAAALDALGQPLTTDQRGPGFPRIRGSAVDIGAFEFAGDTMPPTASPTQPMLMAGTKRMSPSPGTGRTRQVAAVLT